MVYNVDASQAFVSCSESADCMYRMYVSKQGVPQKILDVTDYRLEV